MEVVNPFILKNKIGMVKFIDELCNVDSVDLNLLDSSLDDCNNNSETFKDEEIEDSSHDLAVVHDVCENHRIEIEQFAKSSPSARRLLTILTILTQHKQYYTNLRENAHSGINTTLV